MLFRYSDVPEDLRFVDFQLLYFSSPVIDLHYFFSTSLCEEVREYHLDRLMEVKLILIDEITKKNRLLNMQPKAVFWLVCSV
jgi:8-oxo-dGTP pyrophosphatase MutT (NUDIX family)